MLIFLATTAGFALNCLKNSESEECSNYKLSDSKANVSIDNLCKSMPNMSACIIRNSCKTTTEECSPFRILKSLCLDMPRMKECSTFNKLCKPDSQIKQCKQAKLVLPTSKETESLISSICSEMNMKGCECTNNKNCNLESYTYLCKQMPEMSQCADYNNICKAFPLTSFCKGTSITKSVPTMKMYFHSGINDYILFEFILPSSNFEYLLALIVCFSIALFYEYILVVSEKYELFWKSLGTGKNISLGGHNYVALDRSKFALVWTPRQIRAAKSLLRVGTMFLAYLCMLLAMTFNIGLFMAVLLGFGAGRYFFCEFVTEKNIEHCC